MDLVSAEVSEFQKELWVNFHAARGFGIELHHPTANTLRIKLRVPRRIQRVREIDSAPIAAEFHHLRAAVQRRFGIFGMSGFANDAAQMNGSRLLGIKRI